MYLPGCGRAHDCVETGAQESQYSHSEIGLVLVYHTEWLRQRDGLSIWRCKCKGISIVNQLLIFLQFFFSTWIALRIRPARIVATRCPLALISGNGSVSHSAFNWRARPWARASDGLRCRMLASCPFRIASLTAPPVLINWRMISCCLWSQRLARRRPPRNPCASITSWTSSPQSPTMWAS